MSPTTLAAALETATQAALQAGELIRADFHRPGGPRGGGHHAPVDDEAEQVIRELLLGGFPQWSYRGEETRWGGAPVASAEYGWAVDPNDGTASFLEGWRGSAVSIALVRMSDGVPILGVVYAPVAPDDDGDLFTWAEGEVLRRNGRTGRAAPAPNGPRPVNAGAV